MKECTRCGNNEDVSPIGFELAHFVCDTCRNDTKGWEFNGVRVSDMEYVSPEPSEVTSAREAKNETERYN